MQVTTIAGNIGTAAEVSTVQSGKQLTKFSVAIKGFNGNTTWYNCVSFQDRHTKLAQYLTKGSSVSVTGNLEIKKVEDGRGYWVSLIVGDITLLGGKKESSEPVKDVNDDMDSMIPF